MLFISIYMENQQENHQNVLDHGTSVMFDTPGLTTRPPSNQAAIKMTLNVANRVGIMQSGKTFNSYAEHPTMRQFDRNMRHV